MNDNLSTTQDTIDNLISIEKYVELPPKVYFACKALNYRTFHKKWDGNRPLSVFVNWEVCNNKLKSTLIFDNPLLVKGDEVAEKLIDCLHRLNIDTTDDIYSSNVENYMKVFE